MAERKRRRSEEDDLPSRTLHKDEESEEEGEFDASRYDLTEAKVSDDIPNVAPVTIVSQPGRGRIVSGRECPYMDTITRKLMDFDAARECSVSGVVQHIYACLVCGKYFQGRGVQSQAYLHAVHQDHHIYLNLETEKVYCLPEGYEIEDASLSDIQYVLDPKYTVADIAKFDSTPLKGRSLDGKEFIAGCLGLTPTAASDSFNCIVQALAHVPPLRDFFALRTSYKVGKDSLVDMFAITLRKLWNHRAFRGHVSPHALLQAATLHPERKYKPSGDGDALEFLTWILNSLHLGLVQNPTKKESSIIHRAFQGEVIVYTEKDQRVVEENTKGGMSMEGPRYETVRTERKTPFLFLSLDLPPAPLFKDAFERTVIPQVPLQQLLKKFDGETVTFIRAERKKHRMTRLPPYLILHYKRFSKNQFFFEKNPTSIAFPVKGLDLVDLYHGEEKVPSTKYNLIANISHEGKPESGKYKAQVLHKALNKWFEYSDLVVEEKQLQSVGLSDVYIQIYEQQKGE